MDTLSDTWPFIVGGIIGIIWASWGDIKYHLFDKKRLAELRRLEKEREEKREDEKEKKMRELGTKIINLLKEKNKKISVSDINAFIKNTDLEETKMTCEVLYKIGKINFAGNGRYFILTEGAEEKKETKTKPEKESIDPTKEVRKYAKLRDDGLITEEDYQAKKQELLGI